MDPQISVSLPVAPVPNIFKCPLNLLQDPAEAQRQFKQWLLSYSKERLYKDKSALLPFPQFMYNAKPDAVQVPTITVTSTKGRTLFLHENWDFRDLVRRSWRRIRR